MQSGFPTVFLRGLAVAGLLVLTAVPAGAVSIGLAPVYPDLTTSSANVSYSYTAVCQNGSGSSIGSCSGSRTVARWDLSYGVLTVTKDGSQTLNPYGTGLVGVSNTTGLNYDLKVVVGFGAGGTSISGILANNVAYSGYTAHSSNLSATGLTADPNFQSGTIVSGTPTSAVAYGYSAPFGYSGSGTGGVFEFVFNNVGGDMDPYAGADWGGIIISTFNLTGTAGGWDAAGVNFWKTSHSGTAGVDTFVPVPGAVWMFGSALATLGWLRKRAGRVTA